MDELYVVVKLFMMRMFNYINKSLDEEFKLKFMVIFGSSGYYEYFFKLFFLIEDDVLGLKLEGYEEFKRVIFVEIMEFVD